MTNMKKGSRGMNALGVTGYVFALFQWFWLALVTVPSLVRSPWFQSLFTNQDPAASSVSTSTFQVPSSILAPLSWVAVGLGLALIVYVFYLIVVRGPRAVGKTGETVSHVPAKVITPFVVKRLHLPEKKRKVLSASIILTIKLTLTFVPLILLACFGVVNTSVSFNFTMQTGLVLFSCSLLSFVVQYFSCKLLDIDYASVK